VNENVLNAEVQRRLFAFLDGARVPYRSIAHAAAGASRDAAAARGEDLSIGGKALVLAVDDTFRLCVLRAHERLDSKALRRHFKASGTRFASREELLRLTGLVPGTVPPFGRPVLELPLVLDRAFLANEEIAFNAASLEQSVVMRVADYVRIAEPELADFAAPAD
jgi:prolyl-tRNA editing enzyme YbaK/EbsC (Cys-tRNA(Pro) deacylase)